MMQIDPAAPAVVCSRCGTPSTGQRQGSPWCSPCGIWLTLDEPTAEWVSYAERLYRDNARRAAVQAMRNRRAVADVFPTVRRAVPAGWTIEVSSDGGCFQVRPPQGPVDVAAYIGPRNSGTDTWSVHIDNRSTRVSAAVFAAGGAHVARFDTALAATAAAVRRLRVETV
jgi:hypothetical protein